MSNSMRSSTCRLAGTWRASSIAAGTCISMVFSSSNRYGSRYQSNIVFRHRSDYRANLTQNQIYQSVRYYFQYYLSIGYGRVVTHLSKKIRSEERRVGKEYRTQRYTYQ